MSGVGNITGKVKAMIYRHMNWSGCKDPTKCGYRALLYVFSLWIYFIKHTHTHTHTKKQKNKGGKLMIIRALG